MTKPAITKRLTKGSLLTYSELDTNFQNLADATIGVTDGTNSHQFNLNDTITFTAGSNITLGVNPSTGAITINSSSGGTITPGHGSFIPMYSGSSGSTGTTLEESNLYTTVSGITWDDTTFQITVGSSVSLIASSSGPARLDCGDIGALDILGTEIYVPNANGHVGGSGTSNITDYGAFNLNGRNGQLFHDGNLHMHSVAGAIWINPLDSSNVRIGTQYNSGSGGGLVVQGSITSNTSGNSHSFFYKSQTGFNVDEPSLAMDNLNVRLRNTSGNNLMIECSAVSGSFVAYTTHVENIAGSPLRGSTNSSGITFTAGTWTSANAYYQLASGGDTTQMTVIDNTNSRIYRVTCIHCAGAKGGYIAIERMM